MAKNLLTATVKVCIDDVMGLVEQLKSLQTYKLFEGDDMKLVNIDDVIEIFTNHIKAERIAGDDTAQWISCNKRFPKEHVCEDGYVEPSKYVLVIDINGKYGISRYWGNRRSKASYPCNYPDWMDLDQDSQDVIAWRPLPETYKAESEEK